MSDPVDIIYPHCDAAVLHAPRECEFCDQHPQWQELRRGWGIAFTGHQPEGPEVPCPSDTRRGRHGAHTWGGNRPTRIPVPVTEAPHSRAFYGAFANTDTAADSEHRSWWRRWWPR